MKIIGLGEGRTGTTSLKAALDILGFGPVYHAEDLLANPGTVAHWNAWSNDKSFDPENIFESFASVVDYPAALFWKELYAAYPEAKFILTIRDADSWYDSMKKTLYMEFPHSIRDKIMMTFKVFKSPKLLKSIPVYKFMKRVLWRDWFEQRFDDRTFTIKKYNERIARIQEVIPGDQLFFYNVADGWEPLCRFLAVPQPKTSFPFLNQGENHKERVYNVIKSGKA